MLSPITIITGPTASGKSAFALSLAQKTGGVIINADSQQLYRELRVLTARPSPEEEALAPHRLYGTLPAHTAASAGHWLNLARMEIDWARESGKPAIVAGGTGLYIGALLNGIATIPDITEDVRIQSENDYESMGKASFEERLKWVDPGFFERLAVTDRQRLVRAWAVWLGTGKPLTFWQNQTQTPPYSAENIRLYTVAIPRETLYARCNQRFDTMLQNGALEEVRGLLALNLPESLPAMKSVGVPELTAHLRGEITLEEAVEKATQATRNYAKRQLTWFRNQLPHATPLAWDANPETAFT
ncbi:MAG: tRNA (adenosine(37)-N6)-dimethylallyltransferase MiaA [Rickettsiales bacterium]|nr:tRNA (adenosine(37)-N6)-dimethylallyltransferase MiaA [Rickettsiales bacterium]